jgi:hydrogenase-4 component B
VNAVLELGAVGLAIGAAVPALSRHVRAGLAMQIVGLTLLATAGLAALLASAGVAVQAHTATGFRAGIAPAFGLDQLSGLFLALLALTALPTLIYADAYLAGIASAARRRAGAALMAAFLLSLVGVLTARSATGFLACWELMTMLPAAAILVQRRDRRVRAAVYAYLAITHVAGTGVWIAVLVLAHHGGLGHPHALAHAGAGAQTLVALAALIGFGAKAGLIPVHSWLPRAHPVAPAPMSALMSGMMVKVALYGMIRVEFESLPGHPLWLGLVLLGIGLISACGGVLWASAQRELKRLLAFSTVENVGIITMALGAALLLLRAGQPVWASLAFAAALLHTINHAFIKTLLFLGAGAF